MESLGKLWKVVESRGKSWEAQIKIVLASFLVSVFSVLQIIAMAGKAAGPTVGSTLRVDVRLLLHIRNIVAI